MKRLRILQISTFESIGGAAQAAHRLHNEFNKREDSTLLVGKKSFKYRKIIEFPLLIRQFQRVSNKIEKITGLPYFFNPSYLWFLKKENYAKYDIINLHNIHGGYFNVLSLFNILKHKKVVWTLHDMWAMTGHCAYSYGCNKWEESCKNCNNLDYTPPIKIDRCFSLFNVKKKILGNPNIHLVTPSKWLKELVEKSMKPANKVTIIPYGIDINIFKPMNKKRIRKKYNLDLTKKIILFSAVAINSPQKGFGYLVKALEKIKDKNNLILLIIGANSKSDLNISGFEIVNTGYINSPEKMAEYYSCADIFLFPSIQDNLPLVVLEAMSCGLPVITFNTGGIPELVKHMGTGYVAKYRNVDDLVKGLNLFLSNEELLKKCGVNARKRVKKYFTLDIQVRKYLELYHNLIQ